MRALACMLVLVLAGCLAPADADDPAAPTPCADASVAFGITVGNMAGGGRVGASESTEAQVDLSLLPAGYDLGCVRAVRATIVWTNTPTAGADLYAGLSLPASDILEVGFDHQQRVADGTHTETVTLGLGYGGRDPALLAEGLVLVVFTDWVSLSQAGLPVAVGVDFLV